MKYNRDIVLDHYKEHGVIFEPDEVQFDKERKWRFDFASRKYKVALEIEGGVFQGRGGHTSVRGFKDDLEKYNEATAQGWRLIRSIPSQCCMNEIVDAVVRTIEQVKISESKN